MKTLKKILLSCLAVVLIGIFSYVVYYVVHYKLYDDYKDSFVTYEYREGSEYKALSDSAPKVEGMDLVAENDNLKLYANTATGEVAIYDKRNDNITYSNPQGADQDPIANGVNKDMLKSQMCIYYYNTSRGVATMNTYEKCTSMGQLSVESIENGIRFIYHIGDLSSKTGIVPTKILEARMNDILAKMEEKGAKYVRSKYVLTDGIYELTEATVTKQATLRKMNTYLTEAGYTQEQFEADSAEAGAEGSVPISFEIPMEYVLSEDYIEVNVPTSQIVENGGGSIFSIEVLDYFGAAGTKENGYMFVPNGSGSLINFNNGKTNAAIYTQYVYGLDPLAQNYYQVQYLEEARLPLWGIQTENSTILATIESGASLAAITASVSGRVTSYNSVYGQYTLRGSETLNMSGSTGNESDLPVVETDFTKADITTRFTFLTKEYSGYSGMANYYRERLIHEGILKQVDTSVQIPLYLDILGGVSRSVYTLGVEYNEVFPMTTFEEAKEIGSYFIEEGITPILNYQGWFNGGYYHKVPDHIKGVKKIGGKKDLEALTEYVESNNGKVYGDVQFQKVTYDSKGYNYAEETSRYYASGYPAIYGIVNPKNLTNDWSMGYRDRLYYLLSPKYLLRYVENFSKEFDKYDTTGVSLRDLGAVLQSDKKRTNPIDREKALHIVNDALQTLDSSGKQIMVSSANNYAWTYADDIINVPLSDNDFFIVDQEVPFYQMLLHGSINYSGVSVNLSDNYEYTKTILKLIEYGAAPHFTFSWKGTSELKYTSLNGWYNTSFIQTKEQKETGITSFREDAVKMYQEVNAVLKLVSGSHMIQHQILESGVRKVTYDNGVIIYVNPTNLTATVDDVIVNANDYAVKEAR